MKGIKIKYRLVQMLEVCQVSRSGQTSISVLLKIKRIEKIRTLILQLCKQEIFLVTFGIQVNIELCIILKKLYPDREKMPIKMIRTLFPCPVAAYFFQFAFSVFSSYNQQYNINRVQCKRRFVFLTCYPKGNISNIFVHI